MKKILALLLCVAMTAAIVACGGTQAPGTSGATEGTSASTTQTTTGTTQTTTGTTQTTTGTTQTTTGTTQTTTGTTQTTTGTTQTTTGTTQTTTGTTQTTTSTTKATTSTTKATTSTTKTTTPTTKPTTSTTQTTTTPVTPPKPAANVFDENSIVLSFGALSDIHITGSGDNVANRKFRAALAQLKDEAAKYDQDGLDAIAIAGDIADTGKKVQVESFTQIVKESGIANVMLTTGNHDYYGDKAATLAHYLAAMGESYFMNDVDNSMFDKGARHCVLNGSHFFFLEPTKYGSNCPYNQEILTWLDNSLKQVTEADPNAYVFIFTHPMLYKTCYGSDLSGGSWYTTYLTETLSKYPQAVTFGGHLHFPINDERSIMQTAFTSLGCGSVRYLAIERGYSNMASATVPKDAHDVSSGLLVQVDANGNVRITRMYFSDNSTFKEPWEISYPTADGSHLTKYSADRAENNNAPTLAGTPVLSATISPTTGVLSDVMLTVPAGSDDDFVHHYTVTVKNETTGDVATYNFLSDFYRHSQPSGMAETLTFPLDITSAGIYTVEVVAVDSWDAKSGKIKCEATIGSAEGTLSAELPEVYTDFEFKNGTVTDTNGKFDITINGATVVNTPLTFAGKTANVDVFNISASGQNAVVKFKDYTSVTLPDFYNSATGFSIEALYVNRDQSGKQGIVCGTQNPGGWGLAENAGVPYFFVYVGSSSISITAKSATPKTELTHIVCTFIYNSSANKTNAVLYINGELISSGSYTGKVNVHSTDAVGTAFCFGADIASTGKGTDFPMTNFVLADAKIYAHALNFKQAETAYAKAVENFGK